MFANPTFWTAVAFVIFFGILAYYGVPRTVMSSLDGRSKRIGDELAEARRLRIEAEGLLKEYQTKREAAEREAEAIVTSAREEAERLAQATQEKLADFVRRRTVSAEAKIAQAEAQAAAEVRAAAVEAAIRASEGVLRTRLQGEAGDGLVSRAVNDVRAKLQ